MACFVFLTKYLIIDFSARIPESGSKKAKTDKVESYCYAIDNSGNRPMSVIDFLERYIFNNGQYGHRKNQYPKY